MVICGAGAGRSASAEEPPVCGKHLVVLYDFSWRTLERIGRPAVANQRLMDLLFGHGQSVPAWAPGDCISFYSFGMDRDDVEARLPSVPSAEFWRRWNHTLLHQANGSPLQTTDETRARTFLAQNLPSPSTATYWYSLSYYAVPTLVASWPQAYAATTYVFWLSDFFPDYGELRELDEGLVHSRLPMHAATLGRLRTEFEPWEGRLRTIFHSGDELRGWHLAVLEVRPPPLSLDFPDSARLLQTSASGWQLELRAWPSLPTGWRCDKLDLELAEGGGGRIVRRWSASSAETSLALQVAPNSAVRPDGPPLELRGVARLRFVLPGSLGLTLYTTRVIRQATVAVSFLPPLWQRIGRILLVPFIVVVCLLLVAFGRRTRWRLHLGTAELPIEPDLFQSVGHPISVLPWGRNRRYTIRIRIINASDRLNLRRPMPLILLDKVDAPSGSEIEFHLEFGSHAAPKGESVCLPRLGAGASREALLVIDLSNQPEPPQTVGPFRFLVRLAGQKARREWSFALAPDPGNFWLGLDPGTSGACIAGGSNPDDLELVPLRHGQAEEERCVAPSLVYVCTGLREDETALPFSVDGQEIRYLAGDKAAARATLSDAPSRLFRSAKRLIGYGNPFSVLFEGSAVKMRGQDAVAMLADFLVDQASNYFQQQQPQREPIRINKLVLAVPNMFTPGKKEHMRRCCQVRGVQRVLTIYEAEAVLVYYWWHTAKLHPQPIRPERLRSQLGEHVLIMDFGGGGVNFTYAVIEEKEEDSDRILSGSNSGRLQTKSGMDAEQRAEKQVRTRIHTLQRLGFAIGGDHLDWEIARLLWEGIRHTGEPDPYIPPAGVHPGRMRNLLLNTAAKVKVHSCQSWADKRPTEAYAFPQSEFREWKGQLLSAESLLADTGIQARLAELESGIEELRNLCGAEDWRVDTIIFSGRSTRFPALKEQIARKVQSLAGC